MIESFGIQYTLSQKAPFAYRGIEAIHGDGRGGVLKAHSAISEPRSTLTVLVQGPRR